MFSSNVYSPYFKYHICFNKKGLNENEIIVLALYFTLEVLLLFCLTTCVMTIMMARMIMMDIRTLLHNILIKQMSHLICEWLLWLTATGIIFALEAPWSIARYLHCTSIKRKDVFQIHASYIFRINQWISSLNLYFELSKALSCSKREKILRTNDIDLKMYFE